MKLLPILFSFILLSSLPPSFAQIGTKGEGTEVVIPAGNYVLDSPMPILSNTHIRGEGEVRVTLGKAFRNGLVQILAAKGVSIQNIIFDLREEDNLPTAAIGIWDSESVIIKDCVFLNSLDSVPKSYGVKVRNSASVGIYSSVFNGTQVQVDGVRGLRIQSNNFYDSPSTPITLTSDLRDVQVIYATIRDAKGNGIRIDATKADKVIVADCRILRCQNNAISSSVEEGSVKVFSNMLNGGGKSGIFLQGGTGEVKYNFITQFEDFAVSALGTTNPTVSENITWETEGIRLVGGDNGVVFGNEYEEGELQNLQDALIFHNETH